MLYPHYDLKDHEHKEVRGKSGTVRGACERTIISALKSQRPCMDLAVEVEGRWAV